MKSRTLILLDCNTALHYQRADQVDWLKLTKSDEVELIATQVFLREIERQKVFNPSPKLKKRAAVCISWLSSFLDNQQSVRPGVTLRLLGNEPQIDFSQNGLSRDIADDHLVANALEMSNGDAKVMVCTQDLGLRVKLNSRGLKALLLPEELKLPAEPDPQEVEAQRLRNELEKARYRAPKLAAVFEDGNQHWEIEFRRPPVAEIPSTEVRRLDPDAQPIDLNTYVAQASPFADLRSAIADSRRREAAEYNTKLINYFEAYEQFLQSVEGWKKRVGRHFELKVIISNSGTMPATDIDLDLYLPRHVVVVRDLPPGPTPPNLPQIPFPRVWRAETGPIYQPAPEDAFSDLIPHDGQPLFTMFSNFVRFHFSNMKHGHPEACDNILLCFMKTDPHSTEIQYQISAAELPEPVEGTLRLIIPRA